jgi:hypothetical protein
MMRVFVFFVGIITLGYSAFNQAQVQMLVKLTNQGLCLTQEHAKFKETSDYTLFYSLDACLNRGGHLPMTDDFKRKMQRHAKISIPQHSTKAFDAQEWPHFSAVTGTGFNVDQFFLKATSEEVTINNQDNMIIQGLWRCPFSLRAMRTQNEFAVSHIVPIEYAHDNGGANFSLAKKTEFANDFENLIVTHKSIAIQRQRAEGMWLPEENRCWYLKRFDRMMKKYKLSYPVNDINLITRLRATCDS